MSEKKQRVESWIRFMVTRFFPKFWREIKSRLVAQVIGFVLAVLIMVAQYYFGVIQGDLHGRVLSIAWPYAVVLSAFLLYHLVRTPWLVADDLLTAIQVSDEHSNILQGELGKEKAKNEAAPHMNIEVINVVPRVKENQTLTDLFFNTYLTLAEPSQVSIHDFSLEIFNTGQSLTIEAVEDMNEWELVMVAGSYSRSPCTPMARELSRRGDPTQGWLHFPLPDLKESSVEVCYLRLKINCTHGTCYYTLEGTATRTDANAKGIMMRKAKVQTESLASG